MLTALPSSPISIWLPYDRQINKWLNWLLTTLSLSLSLSPPLPSLPLWKWKRKQTIGSWSKQFRAKRPYNFNNHITQSQMRYLRGSCWIREDPNLIWRQTLHLLCDLSPANKTWFNAVGACGCLPQVQLVPIADAFNWHICLKKQYENIQEAIQ